MVIQLGMLATTFVNLVVIGVIIFSNSSEGGEEQVTD